MNPAVVLRRTAKGSEELQTRAHGLEPRLRTALILVSAGLVWWRRDRLSSDNQLESFLSREAAGGRNDARRSHRPRRYRERRAGRRR